MFEQEKTILGQAILFSRDNFTDERGQFTKVFSTDENVETFISTVDQINIVKNFEVGTFRGLHFQSSPFQEKKFIKVLSGGILDFILCLDRNSQYFGKLACVELSDLNKLSLFVPRNFAHGYLTLTNDAFVSYVHEGKYKKGKERGVNILSLLDQIDFDIVKAIKKISDKDRVLPSWREVQNEV